MGLKRKKSITLIPCFSAALSRLRRNMNLFMRVCTLSRKRNLSSWAFRFTPIQNPVQIANEPTKMAFNSSLWAFYSDEPVPKVRKSIGIKKAASKRVINIMIIGPLYALFFSQSRSKICWTSSYGLIIIKMRRTTR